MENEAVHIKTKTREQVLARRDAMMPKQRAAASHEICEQLKHVVGAASHECVAVYTPMKSEVDISEFIAWLYQRGMRVAFPCMNKKGATPRMHMREVGHAAWAASMQLANDAGTQNPEAHAAPFIAKPIKRFAEDDPALAEFPIVPPAGIDAIVVPMVAFDDDWQRLGYGGGNYDEYLGLLTPGTLIVGAAFETQRVPHVPIEPHDLPLPVIVSA